MKKILSVLLVFLMLFSAFAFVGCEYDKGRDNNKKTTEDDITDIVNDYIDKLDAEAFDNMQVTSNNEGHIEVFAFDAEESVGYYKEIYQDGTINQGWAKMRENGDAYLVADENGDRTALDLSTADYYEFLSGLRDSAYDYAREGISYLEFVLNGDYEATLKNDMLKITAQGYDGSEWSFTFENGLLTKANIWATDSITIEYDIEINVPRI